MATIRCEVTTCRYNSARRCTLSQIQIGHQPAQPASTLTASIGTVYDGQPRAGYATEFEEYVAYALAQPGDGAEPGAACLSYAPL
jgi:hypothetical protein